MFMKTDLWCQLNIFLFIWKGNWEKISNFGWGGGEGGGGGVKYKNLFMRTNLWYQMNKFVYEIHIFGVYIHKNLLRSVNDNKNKFMVPNKWFFVYLERKLGANKQFWMRRKRRGRRIKKILKYFSHCNFCGFKQKK